MLKPLLMLTIFFCLFSCQSNPEKKNTHETADSNVDTLTVDFWNGNRSEIRQDHEREILEAILEATFAEFGPWKIKESCEEYPGDEESKAFSQKNHDVLVTIAGNQKFNDDEVIVINKPLAKNLLGYRVPIINQKDALKFPKISEANIKQLTQGIPETWSDANIFRHNGFNVSEEGTFDDIFHRLANDNFDYVTLGANEVKSIFENRASKIEGLIIEDELMFFYPFPLVFYVNPDQSELAMRLEKGLSIIEKNGTLDAIFDKYYGNLVEKLNLKNRQLIQLENPFIPAVFDDLKLNFKFVNNQ